MGEQSTSKTGYIISPTSRNVRLDWFCVVYESTRTLGDDVRSFVGLQGRKGSLLCPRNYNEDPKLGRWVDNQRSRKAMLTAERRDRLDEIGFVWRVIGKKV